MLLCRVIYSQFELTGQSPWERCRVHDFTRGPKSCADLFMATSNPLGTSHMPLPLAYQVALQADFNGMTLLECVTV